MFSNTGYGSNYSFGINVGYSAVLTLKSINKNEIPMAADLDRVPQSGWIGILCKDGEKVTLSNVKPGSYRMMADEDSISGQCPDSVSWAAGGTASFSPQDITVEANKTTKVTLGISPAGC